MSADDAANHPSLEFRVETLQNLLDHLCAALDGALDSDLVLSSDGEPGPTASSRILFRAGQSTGEAFGTGLRRDLVPSGPSIDRPPDETLLERWCEYDASTGWSFTIDPERASRLGHLVWCTVRATGNPFARRDVTGTDAEIPEFDLCPFIRGYITGVTNALVQPDVRVSHPHSLCMFRVRDRKSCQFLLAGSRTIPHPMAEKS